MRTNNYLKKKAVPAITGAKKEEEKEEPKMRVGFVSNTFTIQSNKNNKSTEEIKNGKYKYLKRNKVQTNKSPPPKNKVFTNLNEARKKSQQVIKQQGNNKIKEYNTFPRTNKNEVSQLVRKDHPLEKCIHKEKEEKTQNKRKIPKLPIIRNRTINVSEIPKELKKIYEIEEIELKKETIKKNEKIKKLPTINTKFECNCTGNSSHCSFFFIPRVDFFPKSNEKVVDETESLGNIINTTSENSISFLMNFKNMNKCKSANLDSEYPGSANKRELVELTSDTCDDIYKNRVFLSGYSFVTNKSNVEKLKITHIINASGYECNNLYESTIKYKTYYLKDSTYDDINFTLLDSLYQIQTCLKENEENKILVHCNKGISRSVIVIIFFLMNHLSLTYYSAFNMVKDIRALSNPNMNYIAQLLKLSKLKEIITNDTGIKQLSGEKETGGDGTNVIKHDIQKNNHANNSSASSGNSDLKKNMNKPKIIRIFRIEVEGHEPTFKNIDIPENEEGMMPYHYRSSKGSNQNSSSHKEMKNKKGDSRKPIRIDKRFNYVLTINFKEYYLLLFDTNHELMYKSLFKHFTVVCKNFFKSIQKQEIVKSGFKNLFAHLQLHVTIENSIPLNDESYLHLKKYKSKISVENKV